MYWNGRRANAWGITPAGCESLLHNSTWVKKGWWSHLLSTCCAATAPAQKQQSPEDGTAAPGTRLDLALLLCSQLSSSEGMECLICFDTEQASAFQVKSDLLQETRLMFASQVQFGAGSVSFQCSAGLFRLPALLQRAQAEIVYPSSELQPSAYAAASTPEPMIKNQNNHFSLPLSWNTCWLGTCSNNGEFEIGPVVSYKWIVTQVMLFCITTSRLWLILHDTASRLLYTQHLVYSI